jgi:hypothetical protein
MLDEAEGKVEAFQTNVATWFDGAMDRTSGAYKRWIHRLTFWAGFVVAIAFNVNSLQLIDNLWRDPLARAGLVAQAQRTTQDTETPQAFQEKLAAQQAQGASAATPETPPGATDEGEADAPTTGSAPDATPECACDTDDATDIGQKLALPIGWTHEAICDLYTDPRAKPAPRQLQLRPQDWSKSCKALKRDGFGVTLKIFLSLLGLAITGLAVSLGSPFWFGTLQSVTNIRATGIKPDRTDGTAQK